MDTSKCSICGKDFTGKEFELLYCLCDTIVCKKCLKEKGLLVDDKTWKCPKCNQLMDIETTQLFRYQEN